MESRESVSKSMNQVEIKLANECHKQPPTQKAIVKPNAKRYLILFLFGLNCTNKAFQYIQLAANTKKIAQFYQVDNYIINATSVLFLFIYLILSLPACYIIDRIGLRNSVIVSSLGTAIGSIIKCFSCNRSGIYLLFTGLTFVSFSEQLIYSIPSRLASVWFPDDEVSMAVALFTCGYHIGEAIGFLAPQFQLRDAITEEEIGACLFTINLTVAIISVLALVADILLFDEAPQHAPGQARLNQIQMEAQASRDNTLGLGCRMRLLFAEASKLLRDRNYLLLNVSYGINIGLAYAMSIVMNQILDSVWPGDDMQIAATGFILVMTTSLATPFVGRLMDKYRRYKLIYTLVTISMLISFLLFGLFIELLPLPATIYGVAVLIGVNQTGIMIGGLELAVELTYPASEIITSTLMNISPQIFGIPSIFLLSYLADFCGNLATTGFFVTATLVAIILQLNIAESLNRQMAVKDQTLDPR